MKKRHSKFKKIIFILIIIIIAYIIILNKQNSKTITPILENKTSTEENSDKNIFERIINSEVSVPDQNATAKLKDGYGEFKIEDTTVEGSINIENVYTIKEISGEKNFFGIASVSPSGSGIFQYLVWYKNSRKETDSISSIFLGDRIAIDKISTTQKENEIKITLETRERKEDEPMTEEPTVKVTRTFETKNGIIVEITN